MLSTRNASRSARYPTGRMSMLVLGLAFLSIQPTGKAQVVDSLSFFKSYFVTGSYQVAGVGLRGTGQNGLATGTITMDLPDGAEVLAAFLYWQVVSTATLGPDSGSVGVTFNGRLLSSAAGPYGRPLANVLGQEGSAPCWSSGGGTGSSGGEKRNYSYRADVLRFLDVDEETGNPVVDDHPYEVQVPDSGSNGNAVPIALGASLVAIYRVPGEPLNAVVLYDGSYTMDQSNESMHQTIAGFYQAADTSGPGTAAGTITHIVGSGQASKSELLRFNGGLIAANPFDSSEGDSWDVETRPVTFSTSSNEVTTSVDHAGFSTFDCLTWGAVVFRTQVKDTDEDGLLDIWESSAGPLYDPNGEELPRLSLMGADPGVKDVFVELGFMTADGNAGTPVLDGTVSYGGVPKPAHTHLPDPAALKMMGDAFWCAGTVPCNPAVTHSDYVHAHFDVGNDYPVFVGDDAYAERYLIRGVHARGGEAIDEMATVCTPDPDLPAWPWLCQYSGYRSGATWISQPFPGTVEWKSEFRFLRDEWVAGDPAVCEDAGESDVCRRRFDGNRQQTFRYGMFAHALGLPMETDPCLNGSTPTGVQDDGTCATAANPNFHAPRTYAGIGDYLGSDFLVTLGAFNNSQAKPVGTTYMQAVVAMHEMGHNFGRKHGGELGEVNCKPNYLSIMNYLFLVRGLLDADGSPHIDYSGQTLATLNENDLSDGSNSFALGSVPQYRTAWYAPAAGLATKHCDGSAPAEGEQHKVRVDGPPPESLDPIDWDLDPSTSGSGSSPLLVVKDINFNGVADGSLSGSNDWANLRLNQVGSRRNVAGLSLGVTEADLAESDLAQLDLAQLDLAQLDLAQFLHLAQLDLAQLDLAQLDLAQLDLAQLDLAQLDLAQLDLAQLDLAQLDLAQFFAQLDLAQLDLAPGAPGEPAREIDLETVDALNAAPVANGNTYSAIRDTQLVVAAPGVLGNDTDTDNTSLTAALVLGTGPLHGTLILNPNGSFTYMPNAGFVGSDSFQYTANDVSRSSTPVTVTITVNPAYDFEGVQNVPPPAKKAGSTVSMVWRYKNGPTVVNSSLVNHRVTVTRPSGGVIVFTNTDSGSSSFRYSASKKEWTFNLQTKEPNGTPYAVGAYQVQIESTTPGYRSSPVFPLTLVK